MKNLALFFTATTGLIVALFFTFQNHPSIAVLPVKTLHAFYPTRIDTFDADWVTRPFFYTLGAWPKKFEGETFFYTLPYRKGPPQKFIDQISIKWAAPDIKIILEGPQTLVSGLTPTQLKNCFEKRFACFLIRRKILAKSFDHLKAAGFKDFDVNWFEVENTHISPEERTQGVYIYARTSKKVTHRYLLIQAKGATQSISLEAPRNALGEKAEALFEQSIGSLQISSLLEPGREWVRQGLEKVQLSEIETTQSIDDQIQKISEIQALLISQISVDPQNVNSFYHLAGTSVLLRNILQKQSEGFKNQKSDWYDLPKNLIEVAAKYANDIQPENEKTKALQALQENLFLEKKKGSL